MELQDLSGKTIRSATQMKKPGFDDYGWIKLDFTDGTSCVLVACYGGYSGKSEEEYPTGIYITDSVEGIVPLG